ncbi:MAG TPA: hypothetical protein PKE21_14515 [Flavobacteriales bacterium]|nr:hypothetical protein [Flavobacteriales bacterium]HMR28693.1 hypothetical protein [Flavobacteriales bacterium]
MNPKVTKAIVAGIAGTAVMTLIMKVAPMMGMPKMDPAAMLSMMMGVPLVIGWVMHFMIGIVFAIGYALFFMKLVRKVSSPVLKGALFGLAAFVFAQLAMGVMGAMMGGMPPMEGSMMLMAIGSIMGHVVFGIVVALMVKDNA